MPDKREEGEHEALDPDAADPDAIDPAALDPEDEALPVDPGRRRLQTWIGLAVIAAVLVALLWFVFRAPQPEEGPAVLSHPSTSFDQVPA